MGSRPHGQRIHHRLRRRRRRRLRRARPARPDLVIVLGGPIGAYEDAIYPFLTPELRLVERRLAGDRPLLGICLGAQIMAERSARAASRPGAGVRLDALELTEAGRASCIAPLAGEHTNMLHWHNDTFDLPGGATLLASTAVTPHQVFSYGSSALAFQCHPEARVAGFERWLVGHTGELKAAGVDIPTLAARPPARPRARDPGARQPFRLARRTRPMIGRSTCIP